MTVLVDAHELTKDYVLDGHVIRALRGVSLEIQARDYVAVMGPSGCGKSTLLHVLGAVDVPTTGRLHLLGRAADELSDDARSALRLHHLGFVFQRFFLLPMLTAAENISLPLRECGVSKAERERRVREVLEYVGLGERAGHKPGQLSGGEQQRVAIARAVVNRPELLLADEPTGELDAGTGTEIAELLDRLNRDGTTIVLVTHNQELASRARHILTMRDGCFTPATRSHPQRERGS